MLVVCLEACAVVGLGVWRLSVLLGFVVVMSRGCEGCLKVARACKGAVFSEIDVLGIVKGVKASFYRQRRRQILFQMGKEYSKDNAISTWYLIRIQPLQFRMVIGF